MSVHIHAAEGKKDAPFDWPINNSLTIRVELIQQLGAMT